jgi:hypothetical protein
MLSLLQMTILIIRACLEFRGSDLEFLFLASDLSIPVDDEFRRGQLL